MNAFAQTAKHLVISLLTLCGLLGANSLSANELKWYASDFFPCHILIGPQKNTGYCDKILQHIVSALPQYQHKIEHVVLRKLVSAPDFGDAFCTLQLLKTEERETRFTFSDYFLVAGLNGIFIRHDDDRFTPYMVDDETISLASLFAAKKLVLARDVSRTYGKAIDTLITDAGDELPQVKVPSDARFAELLKNHRIDYTVAYPTELFDRESGKPYPFLRFLQIHEPQQRDTVHAACSNGVPSTILDDINQVIHQYRDTLYHQWYQHWLPESVYRD